MLVQPTCGRMSPLSTLPLHYKFQKEKRHPISESEISLLTLHTRLSSFVEVNLFIICASMPTFRRFFRYILPRLFGSTDNNSGIKAYGSSSGRLGRQREYAQFSSVGAQDENGVPGNYEMGHVSRTHDGDGAGRHTADVYAVGDREPSAKNSDDNLILEGDKAIVQTRTFIVEYNK